MRGALLRELAPVTTEAKKPHSKCLQAGGWGEAGVWLSASQKAPKPRKLNA